MYVSCIVDNLHFSGIKSMDFVIALPISELPLLKKLPLLTPTGAQSVVHPSDGQTKYLLLLDDLGAKGGVRAQSLVSASRRPI